MKVYLLIERDLSFVPERTLNVLAVYDSRDKAVAAKEAAKSGLRERIDNLTDNKLTDGDYDIGESDRFYSIYTAKYKIGFQLHIQEHDVQ